MSKPDPQAVRSVWSRTDWKRALEGLKAKLDVPERISRDPVSVPRSARRAGLSSPKLESLAMLSALLAHGRASQILTVLRSVAFACDGDLECLLRRPPRDWRWPAYRFARSSDIEVLVRAIVAVEVEEGGFGAVARQAFQSLGGDPLRMAAELRNAIWRRVSDDNRTYGVRHLLPDPLNSAAKRWMLFLRWMARPDDGIDLGLWPWLSPARLRVPLDRHVFSMARRLGWTARRSPDAKAAEEITSFLRWVEPDDPLRYDFALCHWGMTAACLGQGTVPAEPCPFRAVCQIPICQAREPSSRVSSMSAFSLASAAPESMD